MINKPLFANEFLFKNQFGVLEVLLTTGLKKEELLIERTRTLKTLGPYYEHTDGDFISETTNTEKQITAYTGYLTKEEVNNLEYLFKTNYLFWVQNDKFIRCELEGNTYKLIDETTNLYSLEFKFRPMEYMPKKAIDNR